MSMPIHLVRRLPQALSQVRLARVHDCQIDAMIAAGEARADLATSFALDNDELRYKARGFRDGQALVDVLAVTDPDSAERLGRVLDLFWRAHKLDVAQRRATETAESKAAGCCEDLRAANTEYEPIRAAVNTLRMATDCGGCGLVESNCRCGPEGA